MAPVSFRPEKSKDSLTKSFESQFDAEAATNAYLAQLPAEAKARSDAYFEGGYWLILWDFLYGAAISLLLLSLRWSAGMRDLAERITRFKALQSLIYWAEYLLATTVLGFPLVVYEGYFREHHYGLATQTFGPWMFDQFKALLVGLVIGGLVIMGLFAVVRRLPRTWWIWGAVATTAFMAVCVRSSSGSSPSPSFATRIDFKTNSTRFITSGSALATCLRRSLMSTTPPSDFSTKKRRRFAPLSTRLTSAGSRFFRCCTEGT